MSCSLHLVEGLSLLDGSCVSFGVGVGVAVVVLLLAVDTVSILALPASSASLVSDMATTRDRPLFSLLFIVQPFFSAGVAVKVICGV